MKFQITEASIGCGICLSACRAGSIPPGDPAPGKFKTYSPARLVVEMPKILRPYKTLGGEDPY